jgi:two-component system, NarL family, sensor histidine kinase UhpB
VGVDYREYIELLLVEDSPADAMLLAQVLQQSDICRYGLRTVTTIADAEVALCTAEVDCVLLDLALPDSDGIDSVRRVHEISPHVPIIVLTGRDDSLMGLDAINAGAQDFLVKGQPKGNSILRCARWAVARVQASEAPAPKNQDRWRAGPTGSLLDGMAAAAAHLDGDLSIVCVNPAFEALVGYDQQELTGAAFSDLLEVDDLISSVLELRSVLKDESPAHRSRVVLRNRGGGSIDCTVVVSRVDESGDAPSSLLAMVCDIEG